MATKNIVVFKIMIVILFYSLVINGISASLSCTFFEERVNLTCTSKTSEDLELTKSQIPNAGNTQSLSVTACRITGVNCDAFQELGSLQHLNMAENKIQELKTCTFNGLFQLKSIDISFNKISTFPQGLFDGSPNIEALILQSNNIKTIQPNFFQTLHNLKTLDLSNNAIVGPNLNSSVFVNNKQLSTLDLSRNDMRDVQEDLLQPFQYLQDLYLNKCFLTAVPKFAITSNMKRLKQLELSTNVIKRLDDPLTFVNLDELQLLNLEANAIEYITDSIFAPLRKLKTVLLKRNHLKLIPENLFQNLPKLVNLDLSYNSLEFLNMSSFKHSPMKNLNIAGNKLSYLPVNFYDQLITSGGKLKKLLFSDNPWQCACLMVILAELKAHNVEYNTAKFNGGASICVSSEVMTCNRE